MVSFEVFSKRIFRRRHAVAKGALVLVLVQVHIPRVSGGITLYGFVARLANVSFFRTQHIAQDETLDSTI